MIARDLDRSRADARLDEAAATGERLEVILVLRGKVRRGAGAGCWRMRLESGRVVTFRSEVVVAATPLPGPARGRRS